MNEIGLIDSNILVYAFDRSEPEKRRICKKLLEECWLGKKELAVSVQNLSEFYVAVTGKIEIPLAKTEALELIQNVVDFRGWRVLPFDAKTIILAVRINKEYNVPYWDALIAATMKEKDVSLIYTENEKDFKNIPWLHVVNPIG